MTYPHRFIKGIPNKNFITPDGDLKAGLFLFNPEHTHNRTDNYIEESINWYDCPEALTIIFEQRKNDDYQFKEGVAIFLRERLDNAIHTFPKIKNKLFYERKPIINNHNNPYHGNLLLDNTVSSTNRKYIGACLALLVEDIQYRDNK